MATRSPRARGGRGERGGGKVAAEEGRKSRETGADDAGGDFGFAGVVIRKISARGKC